MNLRLLILISLFSMALLTACGTSTGKVVYNSPEKVSVRLPVPVNDAAFTPFFVTLDKGYYAQEGLDVTFNFASSETNPAKMVATGADDFGVLGGPDTLLVARSRGLPLKAFAILHQHSQFPILITKKGSGLTKVEDLEGKKIGFFYGHISTDVLRNLLRKNKIHYEEVDIGFDFTQFIAGKIDAQFGFRTHAPMYLKEHGVEINIISPEDYGIDTHGYTIFATENTLNKRPELAEKFWRATSKGIQYTLDHPEEAVKSITTRDENLKYEIELEKLLLYNKVIGEPYGYMNYQMFEETYARLQEENVIETPFTITDAYTTVILKSIFPGFSEK